MKRLSFIFTEVISYFFILLFMYAGVNKLLDFENFQVQIAQSPLLSSYAGIVSYLVIIIELIIVAILLFPKTKLIGLYASLGIMSAFTMYIYLILEYSEFVPCSCGGILENMSWRTHLIFNAICVIILMIAIFLSQVSRNQKAKKYLSMVSLIVIVNSLSVYLLYIQSENQLRKNNNFTRRYIPHVLKDEVRLDINYNSFYFIGQDNTNIYLGNTTAPLNLTIVQKDLQSFSKFRIPLDPKSHPFKSLRVTLQVPYYYIYDGTVPIIYKGRLDQADSLQTVSLNDMYFDQLNIISDTSLVFRSQSSKFKTFVIGTYQNHQMALHYDILGTQNLGYIENDGLLISDFDKKNFIYLYYYKNVFIVVNNITHQQHQFKLISFNKKQKTETVKLPDGSNKIKNPLQQSVKNATVSGNLLFVNSNSKATHDGIMQWNKASIIDLYKINQQYYSGSFLVPDSHGEKVKDMFIDGEFVYFLIGNEIIKYHFAQPILDEFRR